MGKARTVIATKQEQIQYNLSTWEIIEHKLTYFDILEYFGINTRKHPIVARH